MYVIHKRRSIHTYVPAPRTATVKLAMYYFLVVSGLFLLFLLVCVGSARCPEPYVLSIEYAQIRSVSKHKAKHRNDHLGSTDVIGV